MGCTSNTDTAPRSQIAKVEDKAGSSVGWACLVVNKSLPYERAVFLSHIQSSLFTYISEVNAVKMLTSRFHNAISPTKAVLSWSQPVLPTVRLAVMTSFCLCKVFPLYQLFYYI